MISMAKQFNIEVCLSTNLNIKDPDLAQKYVNPIQILLSLVLMASVQRPIKNTAVAEILNL